MGRKIVNMKLKAWPLAVVSLLLLTLTTQMALGVEDSIANKKCPKVGMKKTEGVNLYNCTKVGKSNLWTKQASSVTTSKPSTSILPTPSTSPTSDVGVLPIKPVVTLGMISENNSQTADIYLEASASIPTTGIGLFVEAPNYFSQVYGCRSGSQFLGTDAIISRVPNFVQYFRSRGLSLLGNQTGNFLIPTVPITVRCFLRAAAQYKFSVYQISGEGRFSKIAISETLVVANPEYVPPTPTPSPSPSYPSKPVIVVGQTCAPEGSSVIAADGNRYTCKKSLSDSNLYWNK